VGDGGGNVYGQAFRIALHGVDDKMESSWYGKSPCIQVLSTPYCQYDSPSMLLIILPPPAEPEGERNVKPSINDRER
jgi:hypothetical protein